jgi:hypothetical protein
MPRVILPSLLSYMKESVIVDNLTESLVLIRNGVALAAQSVRIRKVSQSGYSEGEAVSVGAKSIEIIGETTLNVRQEDRFSWDGSEWEVTEASVVGTDHASRRSASAMRI